MLYCVQMDVRVPHDVDPARIERLKAEEKARAQELQRAGKWRHLWRGARGHPKVSNPPGGAQDELPTNPSSLPPFSVLEKNGSPLPQQPASATGRQPTRHAPRA